MTSQLTITDSAIQSGNATIDAYSRGGKHVSPNPIEEFILIQTGSIANGQFKLLDFTMFDYEVRFCSIWTLSSLNPARAGITVAIVSMADTNTILHEYELDDNNRTELPLLTNVKGYGFKIAPDTDVENILIFCKQVHRTDTINLLG